MGVAGLVVSECDGGARKSAVYSVIHVVGYHCNAEYRVLLSVFFGGFRSVRMEIMRARWEGGSGDI